MERSVNTNRSDDFVSEQTSDAFRLEQSQFAPTADFPHCGTVETVAPLVADLRQLIKGSV
jgi:hypothetical protein